MRSIIICLSLFLGLFAGNKANAQERVYVTTDKDIYLAGENLWCSVYCIDDATGKYTTISSVAFLEFHSREKLEGTIKIPLIEGRGCGRLQIPLGFPTGNYSIVAYTRRDGGESKGEFNGKIVTVFNTLVNGKVKDGVEVVDKGEPLHPEHTFTAAAKGDVSVQLHKVQDNILPIVIENRGEGQMQLNVSVYHEDELARQMGPYGYSRNTLLQRKGNFASTDWVDYAGEVIKAKVSVPGGKAKYVYMSAMGNEDDLYIGNVDSLGYVTYYTNNISGKRDLMFQVVSDTLMQCKVDLVNPVYRHTPVQVPVLKISEDLQQGLLGRSMNMQISKRFESDTLLNLMPMRITSFFGAVKPIVYQLDDYTRFPLMEEVVREYVSNLRIRKENGEPVFKVAWETYEGSYVLSKGNVLALLDGVPVRDHSSIINMDPLLVKEIIIYPRKFVLNYFVFEGIVKFNTYKGDMGGLKLGDNVSVITYDGVQYPLAFTGNMVANNSKYPNYNSTIYWNPVLPIKKDEAVQLDCVLPAYKGEFRVVVEGLDSNGKEIYYTTTFKTE